jgi:phosphoenolpyruvate carboxykinase (ATP)
MTEKTEYTGLESHGLKNLARIYWHLPTPSLYEETIKRREGHLAHLGPIVVRTGHHTGRSPSDKLLVREDISEEEIYWGEENQPMAPEKFAFLYSRLTAYLQSKEVFIQECYSGAHSDFRRPVRILTEYAWHSLFARNMFIRELDPQKLATFQPDFTLISVPRFHAIPEIDGTNSETFIIVNLKNKVVLIGGTSYAGEIKKAIFTMMNYYLPKAGVLSMHCSANRSKKGDVALFFGLSGTGKTTLSTDPERYLIGDDEHGWSDQGIFNLEGGCYAKVIRLSKEDEPDIYECTRKFGTILENVSFDAKTRRVDLNDDSLTENTRASFPITHLPRIVKEGVDGHPNNIIFLTYDAFGVLPPVARLTPSQAMYHFISGYTSKVAGTEMGITKPQAVFSACFGSPFMVLSPKVYARLLGERVERHNVKVWLVNTGLTGGPYGTGHRISIKHTRKIIKTILNGELDKVEYYKDIDFLFMVPQNCPGVPQKILNPQLAWKNKEAYKATKRELVRSFSKNFERYKKSVDPDIERGGPTL